MAKRNEARVQEKIIKAFKRIPGMRVENRLGSPMTKKGRADLALCYCGFHGELEVKAEPNDKPTAAQEKHLRDYRRVGAFTGVAGSVEEAKTFVEEWREYIVANNSLMLGAIRAQMIH